MTDIYDIKVPHQHYLDIDGQAVSDKPSRRHEFVFYSGWVQTSSADSDQGTAYAEIGVIDDSEVPKCEARSQRKDGILYFGWMEADQSVCVRTSENRWALVQVASADEAIGGSVVLHIGYLKSA
ncbi:hypothetical protein [Streptomyces sp. NPDC002402]